MSLRPKVGALAVVIDRGRVLLARRRNPPDAGLWGFPGGHVEAGETALAAAARELFEETGVVAEPLHYLTNVDVVRHDESGAVEHHFLLAAVFCRYREGTPVPADDISEAAWVEAGEVLSGTFSTSDSVDRVIRLALQADD